MPVLTLHASFCVCGPCRLGSFAAFTINSLLPGYSYTGPSGVDDSNLCKCNTVAYSLISACDACQGAQWITYASSTSTQRPTGAYVSALAGQNMCTTARRFCLLQREFPLATENLFRLALTKGQMALRFPNPVPSGTRVPHWALLDVTVRCYVMFDGWECSHSTFQAENNWNSNKSYSVGGGNPLTCRFFFPV